MKIYLFLTDYLCEFTISKQIAGNFSFDSREEEENKLINIEAKDGELILCSTDDVKIVENGVVHSNITLKDNSFYTLLRNDLQYLIYVEEMHFNRLLSFTYNANINLNIGYTNKSNIKYQCPYLKDGNVNISLKDNKLILDNQKNVPIYINKKFINTKTSEIPLGSEIFIWGLSIVILNGVLLIKNVEGLFIDMIAASITPLNLPNLGEPQNFIVKDLNLYKDEDYFSKSPRLRRIIETKEIKLTEPPSIAQENVPLLITLGPMLTMGIVSITNFGATISRITSGQVTLEQCKFELITQGAMLASMLLWPLIMHFYNKIRAAKLRKKTIKKYMKYIDSKRKELEEEKQLQKNILIENLISLENCEKIALNRSFNFWDRRLDQNDLLEVRVGKGNEDLDVKIQYPDREFTMDESQLKEAADKLVEDYKYIENVPIRYSFSKNRITAIMGDKDMCQKFMTNTLLQLLTFYSYEDLKIVTFTNDKNKTNWDYLKYFNHSFSNERDVRFFSTNITQSKEICEFLNNELNQRLEQVNDKSLFTPYYFIIIDDYNMVKRLEFIKKVTEANGNIGFSIVVIENKMSKLPSKCNNFISLTESESSILIDAFEKQKLKKFNFEFNKDIDMYEIARSLSNVPIQFADGFKELPDVITFLEMQKVGKVEQLNILSRWERNDSTKSLKAEIGVDEQGECMYLDLHEKFHGPHGLIAGTTGSGKSEFIITYILSLALNYSPEDVAFILIDYKGGGLAFAFENKLTGVVLPHLAGTITNLDKAEMNRTLVSIDSEVKRRQRVFNEARDKCGESTIDIYKYQRLYNEGQLDEPIPHLFIICDEFAELKSQQPEFMDNLISVARIGRSLGVHLILATQKPSGVVDDQIWSNSKFRVCLKVQNESDSKEMLKRPEAAMIKQAGRFYLQVGMDEIFSLGQSGWCGAKYLPSDKPVKQVDRSLNFIDESGYSFKSVQDTADKLTIKAQGEQLPNIMNSIIEMAKKTNKKARRLWLENIPSIILADNLYKKYQFTRDKNLFQIIFGEYDDPENQTQGVAVYNLLTDGNLILYGIDGNDKEYFLNSFVYSCSILHSPEEINIYILDFGSESLRKYKKLPHVGDMVFSGEKEKYSNIIKMIREEILLRKKLFSNYGGQYSNYIRNSGKKLPIKIFIVNSFESLMEEYNEVYDVYPELVRDSERYGILFIFSANTINAVPSKISQNFLNHIAFKLKESSDYQSIFDMRCNVSFKEYIGRGLLKTNSIHEFQTVSIVSDLDKVNDYLFGYISEQNQKYQVRAKAIPKLPDVISLDYVKDSISALDSVPIGIYRKELNVATYDFLTNIGTVITANKALNTVQFIQDLTQLFSMYNMNTMVIDALKVLKINTSNNVSYYNDNYDLVLEKLIEYVQRLIDGNSNSNSSIIIFGIDKMISKIQDPTQLDMLAMLLKKYEKIPFIIVDDVNKIRKYTYESWYSTLFANSEGIWIGKGVSEQSLFSLSVIDRELQQEIKNNMGYIIIEGYPSLIKLIELNKNSSEEM